MRLLALLLFIPILASAEDKPTKVIITYEYGNGKKVAVEETSDKKDADLGPKKVEEKKAEPEKKDKPTRGKLKPNPADEKAVAEHDRVRPRLEMKRPEAVMRMSEELGKPVIAWLDGCLPDDSDDSAEFFAELSEVTHVAMGDVMVGKGKGPRIAFRVKDGSWAWLPDGCVNLENAKKVRAKLFEGKEDTPDTTHLTMMAGKQLPQGYTYNAKNNMVCGPDGCMPATEFVARQAGGYASKPAVQQTQYAPTRQPMMMAQQPMAQPARRYGGGG